jgi:hypothetical protein
VRFKGDAFGQPKLRDAIYGHFQKKDAEEDFIILKSDGFPTYHLANVVDDHLMEVTHVIRGEEWLISAPKHVALYQAFGWQPPTFAHLGLLVNQDGSKLSKRNDDVNLSKYKEGNVFPMALLAWLANLGSSFKSGAKAPRSVEDVAEAVSYPYGSPNILPTTLTLYSTAYIQVHPRGHQAKFWQARLLQLLLPRPTPPPTSLISSLTRVQPFRFPPYPADA